MTFYEDFYTLPSVVVGDDWMCSKCYQFQKENDPAYVQDGELLCRECAQLNDHL